MRPMLGTQIIRVRTTIRTLNKTDKKRLTLLTIHQITIIIPTKVMDHQVTIPTATQDMDTTNPTNRRNRLMYLSRYKDWSAKSNYIRSRKYYDIHLSTGTGSNQKTAQ